jgi:hypothetical protein
LTYFQPDARSNELEYAQDKPSRLSRQANGIRLRLLAGQQAKSRGASFSETGFLASGSLGHIPIVPFFRR